MKFVHERLENIKLSFILILMLFSACRTVVRYNAEDMAGMF
jgi:hypothetical protein